eukprot:2332965-Rhodomonas_salina.1
MLSSLCPLPRSPPPSCFTTWPRPLTPLPPEDPNGQDELFSKQSTMVSTATGLNSMHTLRLPSDPPSDSSSSSRESSVEFAACEATAPVPASDSQCAMRVPRRVARILWTDVSHPVKLIPAVLRAVCAKQALYYSKTLFAEGLGAYLLHSNAHAISCGVTAVARWRLKTALAHKEASRLLQGWSEVVVTSPSASRKAQGAIRELAQLRVALDPPLRGLGKGHEPSPCTVDFIGTFRV